MNCHSSTTLGNNKEFSNQPNTKACEVMCNQGRLALCEDRGSRDAVADSIMVVARASVSLRCN